MTADDTLKPIVWIGSSLKDLRGFPEDVKDGIGYALELAQRGKKSDRAKPLKGFGGAGVVEIVEDQQGDTWRAVYTVQFAGAVYVLHAFQKKSKSGIATSKRDLELIRQRLATARELAQGSKT